MTGLDREIRNAYDALLFGNVTYNGQPVPIYNKQVPRGEDPELYVLYSVQQSFNDNTKSSFNADSDMTILVVSSQIHNNDGEANEEVGNQIIQIIYPDSKGSSISCPSFQVIRTRLVNDTTPEPYYEGEKVIITRAIQFEHRTQQKP